RRALRQLERGLSDRLDALRQEILDLEALLAYEIDFPEEDEGPVSEPRVRRAWSVVRGRVAGLLRAAPEGGRLRGGASLVIPGRPAARPPDRLTVSVVTGQGLPELRRRLAEVAFGRLLALGDVEPVVTRARHRAALERALGELDGFRAARDAGVDAAAAATHLRAAITALDDLIGVVTPDDVLDRVFATFCVGK